MKQIALKIKSYCLIISILLLIPLAATAQSTKVKGKVTDAVSGEPIPFVSIYFTGTTIGTTTDMEGHYYIETTKPTGTELTAMLLGYEQVASPIKPKSFNEINFKLKEISFNLQSVVVKPDDTYIRSILKKIIDNKAKNDPELLPQFNCDIYSKIELDITNIKPYWKNKKLQKNFGFIFDNMDTSIISGKAYLPVMITESTSKYYHSKNPSVSKEIIQSSRISGIKEDYSLSQFTGHIHAKVNFYENYIDIFNVKFASPLSEHGRMFYNYFLIDSLKIDGRKTYKIRFHPKMKSAPVLDGEFNIDSETMGLQSAHVKMSKDINVNWVRNMLMDAEYEFHPKDSIWFHKQDKLFVDFSLTLNDSSKVLSFLGHREVDYSNPQFNRIIPKEVVQLKNNVIINEDILNNDPAYWQKARPTALSEREQKIYNMVDSIKNVPLYRNIESMVKAILVGYYDTKYVGIGPYYKLFSFNNLEGARFQIGARTTSDLSKRVRLTGYMAYSTKDQNFKGGGKVELNFDRQPTRKLTLEYKRDALQLGVSSYAFSEGNFFSSIFSKGNSQRLSYVNEGRISYDHEVRDGINLTSEFETKRISTSKYVPMYRQDSSAVGSVAFAAIHARARFSWNESVNRDYFDKLYLDTDYPIICMDISYAPKNLGDNYYGYWRAEGAVFYDLPIPPIGTSYFQIQGGKIFGKVPYPLLKLHEGNGTYFYIPQAFACMQFYEFASDSWVEFFYSHNFKGFFLGKIPLLKKLRWREVVSLRGVYGSISKENNGTNVQGTPANNNAILLFPKGMSNLKTPYIEAGVGITNIFKLIRVDCFWRMTHRKPFDNVKPTNFAVNVGFDFRF